MATIIFRESASTILRRNQLSSTQTRRQILQLFLAPESGALRHADIEQELTHLDRVTIYRTLQAFSEKGIIHAIPGTDGAQRYAVCRSGCTVHDHHDDHVHFVCRKCHQTQCLEAVHVPTVKVPEGFVLEKAEMIVNGLCKQCA